jgi:preprotein translocase subunit SecA
VVQGDSLQEDREAIEKQGDYTVDEKSRSVILTETGVAKIERLLGVRNLPDPPDRHAAPCAAGAQNPRSLSATSITSSRRR